MPASTPPRVATRSPAGRCAGGPAGYDEGVTIRGTVLRRDPLQSRGPDWPSLALALVLVAVQIAGTHAAAHWQSDSRALDSVAFALLAAGPVALIGRRRY